jgi:hypothetical protein
MHHNNKVFGIGTAVKFQCGRIVLTSSALNHLSHNDIRSAIARHQNGDWGNLTDKDRQANDQALIESKGILSVYSSGDGKPFWIVTEADRSLTTILLPEDY